MFQRHQSIGPQRIMPGQVYPGGSVPHALLYSAALTTPALSQPHAFRASASQRFHLQAFRPTNGMCAVCYSPALFSSYRFALFSKQYTVLMLVRVCTPVYALTVVF